MALQNLLGELALETKQDDQITVLYEIRSAIQAIASTRGIAGDLRVTLLGGSVAVSSGTITNIGGFPAVQLIPSNQNLIATIANINNIGA